MSSQQQLRPAMAVFPNTIDSFTSHGKPGIATVATPIAVSGHDQIVVSIKNSPRNVDMRNVSAAPPYKQLFGFAKVRAGQHFIDLCPLYETIDVGSDYSINMCWEDSHYRFHLRQLVSEEEWMQFKKDILQVYSEQNAKRAALRKMIFFNSYRSMACMLSATADNTFGFYMRRCLQCAVKNDPLRDRQCNFQRLCLCTPFFFLGLPILVVIFFLLFLPCLTLDLLTSPRFCLFDSRHRAFLEAVMTAHPDLDPVLVEEELIQQLRQLADNFTSRHPGVYCRFTSILDRHETTEFFSYYETFQIQFLKFVPDFQV